MRSRALCHAAIRLLERILPVYCLRIVLLPVVWVWALPHFVLYRKHDFKSPKLPEHFRCKGNQTIFLWRKWTGFFYSLIPTFFPERLAEERWKRRCRIIGLENLIEEVRLGRPVILATLHTAWLGTLRYLLASRGFNPSLLVLGDESTFQNARRKDGYYRKATGRDMNPIMAFSEVRKIMDFLRHGNALIMAVDVGIGKQIVATTSLGKLRMASGAIRMARSTGSRLMPCLLYQEKPWRFVVRIGKSIDLGDADISSDNQSAADGLAEGFVPMLLKCADQYECGPLAFWSPTVDSSHIRS